MFNMDKDKAARETWFKNTKAQIWSLDAIVGVALFFGALMIFYVYAANFADESDSVLIELENDG